MPQMSPINWLSLFFMFSATFIMFNVLNYFSFEINNNNKNTENMNKNKNMYCNWKW